MSDWQSFCRPHALARLLDACELTPEPRVFGGLPSDHLFAPKGGPPLHVHHKQEEMIHVLKGSFEVKIGDELVQLDEGGFAYLPSGIPHAFLNLTDQPAELIVVYTPGGGHRFYEELGPATRNGTPDRTIVAAIFEKHDMSLLGPPLSAD